VPDVRCPPAVAFQTRHARQRLRARAIPIEAIELVVGFGRERHTHGATKFFLDRAARARIRHEIGETPMRALGHKLDIAVVVSDGTLITAMYRDRSVRQ
jgi:hypothetical protein